MSSLHSQQSWREERYEVVVRIPFKSRSQRTAAGLKRDVRIALTQMLQLPDRSKDVQVELIHWAASDD